MLTRRRDYLNRLLLRTGLFVGHKVRCEVCKPGLGPYLPLPLERDKELAFLIGTQERISWRGQECERPCRPYPPFLGPQPRHAGGLSSAAHAATAFRCCWG